MMKTYWFLFLLYTYHQIGFASRVDTVNHIISSGQAMGCRIMFKGLS